MCLSQAGSLSVYTLYSVYAVSVCLPVCLSVRFSMCLSVSLSVYDCMQHGPPAGDTRDLCAEAGEQASIVHSQLDWDERQ